jgi:ribonuclease Z
MKEVERQASEVWEMGKAQAAVDFMKVEVYAVRETPEFNGELEEGGDKIRAGRYRCG